MTLMISEFDEGIDCYKIIEKQVINRLNKWQEFMQRFEEHNCLGVSQL